MAMNKEKGTVKQYDAEKGYGFISRPGQEDVFVHRSDVAKAGLSSLNKGDHIYFTVKNTPKGEQAVNLEIDSPLGPNYLKDGYFYKKEGDDKLYLRPEIIDELAIEIAKVLGNRGLKSHQLRRFFNKARGIENRLRQEGFEYIKPDIYSFKRDVAYQVGRGVVPEVFQRFIDRNVELAVQDRDSYVKGFLRHFESVLAYFVYFFRDN